MSYYRGDYYRGDYYRGGFLSSVGGAIGRLAGKLGPIAGVAFGGPAGIAATLAAKALTSGGRRNGGRGGGGAMLPVRGIGGAISRLLPGGETGYYRRRRMNVANPKALRRAIRRAHGFAKLARSVLTFPISKPPKGRPLFKKRRR